MSRLLKVGTAIVLCLSFLAGTAAQAQFTEEEVLRRRIDKMEKELRELRRRIQRRPRAAVDQDQLSEMVRQELEKIQGPDTFRVYWDEGLEMETLDENFKLEIGGRIMADWAWMSADDEIETLTGEWGDGIEFRRARLFTKGSIYDSVGYKLQFDFAGGDADLKDAYLSFKKLLPFGTLKVGHFKEPFSLEELTSSKYITFMERALPVNLAPSRNAGFQVSNHALDERMTWAGGVFWETDGFGDSDMEEGQALTGRITALPIYQDEGARLLHLGLSGSYRSPDSVSYRVRPEMHQGEKFNLGSLRATDEVWLVGAEAALVQGPFSLQGELITSSADGRGSADLDLTGFYVFAGYFLTGEHRPYKTSSGSFSRVKPHNNFDGNGNWGAWEVAARYSQLSSDPDSGPEPEISDITAGLNWYLNPNMRVMWNYVHSNFDNDDGVDDGVDALMMRFQVDF